MARTRDDKPIIEDSASTLDSAMATDAGAEALLAKGDAVLGTIAPILRHLLASDDHALFSDEIVARVRGMGRDVARQLLGAFAAQSSRRPPASDGEIDALAESLAASTPFLRHTHALALEWRATERLQAALALDPVLPPLLQALIESSRPETSALAMNLLAAQARFCQAQQRMQLPLGELPGDLLHDTLLALRGHAASDTEADGDAPVRAERAIRRDFDEGASRLGLLSRVVSGLGGGVIAALSVGHAGAAIFLTALALASDQDRETLAVATDETMAAHLRAALRAAGLKPPAIEEQVLALHAGSALPDGSGLAAVPSQL